MGYDQKLPISGYTKPESLSSSMAFIIEFYLSRLKTIFYEKKSYCSFVVHLAIDGNAHGHVRVNYLYFNAYLESCSSGAVSFDCGLSKYTYWIRNPLVGPQ
ncbi:hypothetical protein CWATWH0402_26 [Crocosphaera watsonii WH 0402]|uniref:Uncharacterized protein n=1 Tax=Crocosphaera watsonii WH 0402 TaxID=1284629 RepID=T2JNC5_CROWT|nr:hypothetical protein CWATWH0402_26 [Crocosphaera watsonii WH 0402]